MNKYRSKHHELHKGLAKNQHPALCWDIWWSWTPLWQACKYIQLGAEIAFHATMSASRPWSSSPSMSHPLQLLPFLLCFHRLWKTHIQPVHTKFSRKLFVFSCVAFSTSVEAPCCSLFSLKMTFDARVTKIWKRMFRIETPLCHARWCYLKSSDIPPLLVSLCHLILVITTGIRLFFFLAVYPDPTWET